MKTINPENNTTNSFRKWFTLSNISTMVMLAFIVAMLVIPNVKAFVIQNLMKVGLFQPSVPPVNQNSNTEALTQENTQDVVFKDGNGNTVSLSELKGKVVFLNFWATWCPPCIAEMPSINELKKRYKGKEEIVFLMVDADSNYEKSTKFMQKRGYDLPVSIAVSSVPDNIFDGSLPTTLILDKQGRLSFKHEGSADYKNQKIVDFIDQLLVE
ncbi:TlpA family protein disulfide reductase [Pedobacter arcticus]|uniref:TlpA family protein disulfide reductase n=1 Tax=Pedobacter arcticus TaxID=752140 RepID=UPI0012B54B7A|nr:TlpA disulfide reductase family protein [Pedobacter arcticus]